MLYLYSILVVSSAAFCLYKVLDRCSRKKSFFWLGVTNIDNDCGNLMALLIFNSYLMPHIFNKWISKVLLHICIPLFQHNMYIVIPS